MNTIETWTEFFGWCTVINAGLLAFTVIAILSARPAMSKMHAKMFGLEEVAIAGLYFKYIAYFKIMVIVFNLTPWVALKLMA